MGLGLYTGKGSRIHVPLGIQRKVQSKASVLRTAGVIPPITDGGAIDAGVRWDLCAADVLGHVWDLTLLRNYQVFGNWTKRGE